MSIQQKHTVEESEESRRHAYEVAVKTQLKEMANGNEGEELKKSEHPFGGEKHNQ